MRDRIAEAEWEGWLGEIEGLQVSLLGARDKIEQIDAVGRRPGTVTLGMPTCGDISTRDGTAAL